MILFIPPALAKKHYNKGECTDCTKGDLTLGCLMYLLQKNSKMSGKRLAVEPPVSLTENAKGG